MEEGEGGMDKVRGKRMQVARSVGGYACGST